MQISSDSATEHLSNFHKTRARGPTGRKPPTRARLQKEEKVCEKNVADAKQTESRKCRLQSQLISDVKYKLGTLDTPEFDKVWFLTLPSIEGEKTKKLNEMKEDQSKGEKTIKPEVVETAKASVKKEDCIISGVRSKKILRNCVIL